MGTGASTAQADALLTELRAHGGVFSEALGACRSAADLDIAAVDAATGSTLLHEAVRAGAVRAVELLAAGGAPCVGDKEGRTPLWYALQMRDETLKRDLLVALRAEAKAAFERVCDALEGIVLGRQEAAAPAPDTQKARDSDPPSTPPPAGDKGQDTAAPDMSKRKVSGAGRRRSSAAAQRKGSSAPTASRRRSSTAQSKGGAASPAKKDNAPAQKKRAAGGGMRDKAGPKAGKPAPDAESHAPLTPEAAKEADSAAALVQETRDGCVVRYVPEAEAAAARGVPLARWLRSLPSVEPALGYTAADVGEILCAWRHVAARELARLRAAYAAQDEAALEDWMATETPVELFLAGYLFTCDCVTYERKDGGQDVAVNEKGTAQMVKGSMRVITDPDILRNHGSTQARQPLALYYTMNSAMRSIGWADGVKKLGAQQPSVDLSAVRPALPQHHVVRTFAPLIVKLSELIASRSKKLTTVFRGINFNVSAKYRVGSRVVWNAFTSTSLSKAVAESFMYGSDGTMFVIVAKSGAADVAFTSVFKGEEELLYDSNIEFKVQWKLSPTLLRMMGLRFDVVVMQEVSGGRGGVAFTPSEQLDALRKVMRHTAAFFEAYLKQYVEGRVARDPSADASEPLLTVVQDWLQGGNGAAPREPLCLLGEGGSGKTSASIAVFSKLVGLEAGDAAGATARPVFPVFIALPAVRHVLLNDNGLDEFIRESFGLSDAEQQALGATYDVVVLLDSLDEVGLTASQMQDIARGGGLLARHVWTRKCCSVVLTCRGEFLAGAGVPAGSVCGPGTHVLFMQPFSVADAKAYVAQYRGEGGVEARIDVDTAALMKFDDGRVGYMGRRKEVPAVLRNPFLLHMACETGLIANVLPPAAGVREAELFEAYLAHATLRQASGGKAAATAAEKDAAAAETEELLEAGELVACHMLRDNEWERQLGAEEALLRAEGVSAAAAAKCLRCLPLRVDDFGDSTSRFTFRHKSLAEFLVARRLLRRPRETLEKTLGGRRFSKDTQKVLQHFAEALAPSPTSPQVAAELHALVAAGKSDDSAACSNAVALLARAQVPFHGMDLSGARISGCDMRGVQFLYTNVKNAVIHDCWVDHGLLYECSLSGSDWTGSISAPLCGHTDQIMRVGLSRDGATVASTAVDIQGAGNPDNSVRIWDGVSGKQLHRLTPNAEGADLIEVSSDGERIACAAYDSAYVYDATTGKQLYGMQERARCLAFSPDGRQLLMAAAKVALHAAATGKLVWEADGSRVEFVGFSDDGARALIAANGAVSVCDALTGKEVARVEKTFCTTCALNGAGKLVTASSMEMGVWDVATGKSLAQADLQVEQLQVSTAVVSRNGAKVVGGMHEGGVSVWDTESMQLVLRLDAAEGTTDTVAVTADGTRAVTGGREGAVRVWDLSGKEGLGAPVHNAAIVSLAATADGGAVASGSIDSTLRVWDTKTGRQRLRIDQMSDDEYAQDAVWGVAMTSDGGLAVSTNWDFSVCVWNTETGQEVRALEGHAAPVHCVAVTPDGARVISGGKDNVVRVWDAVEGAVAHVLEEHNDHVTSVAVSQSGTRAASCSVDYDAGVTCVWDVASGKLLRSLRHAAPVWCVAMTADGSRLVAGVGRQGKNGTVEVWDAVQGSKQQQLKGHAGAVGSVAVDAQGALVVSGSWEDHAVRVWHVASGASTSYLHAEAVHKVAVSADGSVVMSATRRVVWVWDVHSQSQKKEVALRLRRVVGLGGAPLCGIQCAGVEAAAPRGLDKALACPAPANEDDASCDE